MSLILQLKLPRNPWILKNKYFMEIRTNILKRTSYLDPSLRRTDQNLVDNALQLSARPIFSICLHFLLFWVGSINNFYLVGVKFASKKETAKCEVMLKIWHFYFFNMYLIIAGLFLILTVLQITKSIADSKKETKSRGTLISLKSWKCF